ncbi:hypothetical protein BT69DRAFT_1286477 [Atractiella rhizophila]|nr:hypothetical protein BT69DRAFT_1286477 [Atractiella rhizophila]
MASPSPPSTTTLVINPSPPTPPNPVLVSPSNPDSPAPLLTPQSPSTEPKLFDVSLGEAMQDSWLTFKEVASEDAKNLRRLWTKIGGGIRAGRAFSLTSTSASTGGRTTGDQAAREEREKEREQEKRNEEMFSFDYDTELKNETNVASSNPSYREESDTETASVTSPSSPSSSSSKI